MTMIAHAYLTAKEAILKKAYNIAFDQFAESKGNSKDLVWKHQSNNMPVIESFDSLSDKSKKAYLKLERITHAQGKTKEQFKKLYKAEYYMLIYATIGNYEKANGYERWPALKPFATEMVILTLPITVPYVIGAIAYMSAEELYNRTKKAMAKYKQQRTK